MNSNFLNNTTENAVKSLIDSNLTVSVAESCTGGMLAERITSVAGASNVIEIGICAYSNRIKREALGVPDDILQSFGAVSAQTAGYMALGIKNMSGSSLGVGITGVAGPDKSEGKDVGTVFVCLTDGKKSWIVDLALSNSLSRNEIREASVSSALELLHKYALYGENLNNSCPANGPFNAYYSLPENDNDDLTNPTPKTVTSFEIDDNFIITEQLPEDIQEDNNEDISYDITTSDIYDGEQEEEETFNAFNVKNVESLYEITNEGTPFSESKENLFSRFCKFIFPNKLNTLKENIAKSVILILTAVILAGTAFMINYFYQASHQNKLLSGARTIFYTQSNENSYNQLLAKNSNYKAWLKAGKIDAPVYQHNDNEYYLSHNMKKEKSRYGALFFDYRDVVSSESMSVNCTVYGKNMNDGSMFGSLSDYKALDYFLNNRLITLTFADKENRYEVFSVFIINSVPEDDNGNLYNFVRSSFTSSNEFSEWINEAKKRSIYLTDCEVQTNDLILTLVTTSDEFDNARFVIMAKQLDNNEALSNDNGIKVNPSPLYPQAWYDKHNLSGYSAHENAKSESETENETDASSEENNSSQENTASSNSSEASSRTSSQTNRNASSTQTSASVSNETVTPSEPDEPVTPEVPDDNTQSENNTGTDNTPDTDNGSEGPSSETPNDNENEP